MTSLNDTINVYKNKYESEASSSGSGNFIEDPDYGALYFMKPPSYDNEVTITTTFITTMAAATKSMAMYSLNELNNNLDTIVEKETVESPTRELLFGVPLNSSQESSFEGFGSSPFDKLQRLLYSNESPYQLQQKFQDEISNQNAIQVTQKASPGKIVFPKFYDTILDENSCNAVDIQLPRDTVQTHTKSLSTQSQKSNNSDMNPSSELSFNGRIKSLTKKREASEPCESEPSLKRRLSNLMETSLNTAPRFSDSFILKKYSNEKSPDLFGDDDDDDGGGDADDEENTLDLKTLPKHTQNTVLVLDESQPPALTTCNLTDNSFNCPTESSFANDDQTLDCSLIQGSCGVGANGKSSDSFSLFRENCRREREMLRRIRKCLSGVLPPPSVTIPQLDMISTVLSRKDDIFNFFNDIKDQTSKQNEANTSATTTTTKIASLFYPTHTLEETKNMPWRDILSVRQHGLCYNLNKASESNEYLSLSVMERFIGAETASSYQNSPSSAKKRNNRLKLLCQSPGNRLSHLAKRRAIFSSANLATQKTSTQLGPQILVDKKKAKNCRKATPKRTTPGGSKKKNRKTPSSSARKLLFRNDIVKPGPSRETSKRALFQSPAKQLQQRNSIPKPHAIKPELANRIEKSKRALLFSPEKQQQSDQKSIYSTYFASSTDTQLDVLLTRKRNRCDDNDDIVTDELTSQSSKLFKCESSIGLTPRALKIKSESFCIGAGSSKKEKQLPCASLSSTITASNTSFCSTGSNCSSQQLQQRTSSVSSLLGTKLQKAYSDSSAPLNNLTENQKKKLLWAVSQALQERKITAKHESFKQYAAILARVVKRIFQEYYQKNSTSNSETLLRLAKKYVYPVTAGSTADDIYLKAKIQIEDTKRQSLKRISGYIGPEEYQQLKQQTLSQTLSSQSLNHKGSTHNIFNTDNSFDSFGLISQTSSGFCGSTNGMSMSQTSFLGQISQDILISESSQTSNSLSAGKTIQLNTSLQNSSSKSNLCGVVLRENVDCELRRSTQKNFTGKDQRNVSPYVGSSNNSGGSAIKTHSQLIADIANNSAKARRQISFDS